MESLSTLESLLSKKRRVKVAWLRALSTVSSRRALASLMGVITALLLAEVCLRPFTSYTDDPSFQSNDGFYPQRKELGQYSEGVAISHFSSDGARLTGNEVLDIEQVGLILGDSHVEATNVSDQSTMGSVLERISREQGSPLNVCQFGWPGTAAPMYLAVADQMLRKWDPAWVTIILTKGDLESEPLLSARNWRMAINPDLSVRLIDVSPPPRTALESALYYIINSTRRQSALAHAIQLRVLAIRNQGSNEETTTKSAEEEMVPRATARALKQAYGSRLHIVYVPSVPAMGGGDPDDVEISLLDACHQEGVSCISTRAAMLADRAEHARLSRGFHNTAPGSGHLNEVGHEIVAEAIWRMIAPVEAYSANRER